MIKQCIILDKLYFSWVIHVVVRAYHFLTSPLSKMIRSHAMFTSNWLLWCLESMHHLSNTDFFHQVLFSWQWNHTCILTRKYNKSYWHPYIRIFNVTMSSTIGFRSLWFKCFYANKHLDKSKFLTIWKTASLEIRMISVCW